ncbi:MAG: hypothetical protein KC933_24905, partial [Myxococcales bacterium]|nr:hypothetical protein [Myxococcales bacterium]
DRMRLSMGYFPKASEELGAFLGFFDPEFRRFDFYLGMYDAWAQLDLTEEVHPGDDRMQAEWRPLACLIGWFSTGREALRRHCEGEDLRNFRILVQSSLDRLYDACQGVDPRELDPPHPHCARAAAGLPPPRVDGVVEVDLETRRRAKGESKFDHFMRLLDAYRFEFEDLGLDASHAHLGRVKIRRKALGMITALSEAQPSTADRALLLTAGRQLVNTIAYEPPKNWAYVMLGTAVEVGASILPFEWDQSWARLNLALDVKDLTTLVSSSDPRTRLTLALGGELELLFITTPTFAPQIGARVGYQFGTRDAFGVKTCTEARALGENQNCSQVVLQNYYSLAILERFRAQLLLELYPQSFAFASERIDLHLMFGVQLF